MLKKLLDYFYDLPADYWSAWQDELTDKYKANRESEDK